MKAETGVKWLLRIISLTTIPAFIAAVGPQSILEKINMLGKAITLRSINLTRGR